MYNNVLGTREEVNLEVNTPGFTTIFNYWFACSVIFKFCVNFFNPIINFYILCKYVWALAFWCVTGLVLFAGKFYHVFNF